MKPVDQTAFGFPGGNCFSACVASLLELPLDDVPYFMGDEIEESDPGAWWKRFLDWLRPRGWWAVCFELKDDWRPPGLHLLSGVSPRRPGSKWHHTVVAGPGGEVVHDPHPDRTGVLTEHDVIILIPIDPSRKAA